MEAKLLENGVEGEIGVACLCPILIPLICPPVMRPCPKHGYA